MMSAGLKGRYELKARNIHTGDVVDSWAGDNLITTKASLYLWKYMTLYFSNSASWRDDSVNVASGAGIRYICFRNSSDALSIEGIPGIEVSDAGGFYKELGGRTGVEPITVFAGDGLSGSGVTNPDNPVYESLGGYKFRCTAKFPIFLAADEANGIVINDVSIWAQGYSIEPNPDVDPDFPAYPALLKELEGADPGTTYVQECFSWVKRAPITKTADIEIEGFWNLTMTFN